MVPLKDQHVVENESCEFTCELDKPGIQVKWLKDGQPVTADAHFVLESKDTTYKLKIPQSYMEDAAEYTILLPDGKDSKAKLTVDGTYTLNMVACARIKTESKLSRLRFDAYISRHVYRLYWSAFR